MSNLLLVTVDSLRADRVCPAVMPKTAAFAQQAVQFTDCVANGPSTPASFPAILASRQFGGVSGLGLPPADGDSDVQTLAERLSAAGYATAGFTDNHFASGEYRFDRGFDRLHDASGVMEAGRLKQLVQSNLDKDGVVFRTIERVYTAVDGVVSSATEGAEYERAGSLNERALSWIDDQTGDWFVWLHYMDPHHPYEPPAEYRETHGVDGIDQRSARSLSRRATHYPEELSAADWETVAELYDAECAYVDDQFESLLGSLDRRGIRDETTVVFTADHGELFGEHGKGGHPPEFWEPVIRVPLIVDHHAWAPQTVSGQSRLVDVAPTVAGLLGVEPPSVWQGESLRGVVEDGDDHPTYAFGTVGREVNYRRGYVRRKDGWKFVTHDGGDALFDVRATPDELPDDNRLGEGLDVEAALREELSAHRDRMARLRRGEGVAEDEEMVREHLEDLGYLE